MSSSERVLVCGGGLLGGAVAGRLAVGHFVVVVDRLPELAALQAPEVEFRVGDLADAARLRDELEPPAVCVYAAGALPQAFAADPVGAGERALDAFTGFLRFVTTCRPLPHVVLCSSLAVYGERAAGATEDTPVAPVSPYGRNKVAIESMLTRVAGITGFSHAVLRFCGIVGPAAHPGGGWMQRHLVETIGSGVVPEPLAGCEYLFVADAARAVELVVRARGRGVFNVGSGVVRSAAEGLVFTRLSEEFGYRPEFDTFSTILEGVTR